MNAGALLLQTSLSYRAFVVVFAGHTLVVLAKLPVTIGGTQTLHTLVCLGVAQQRLFAIGCRTTTCGVFVYRRLIRFCLVGRRLLCGVFVYRWFVLLEKVRQDHNTAILTAVGAETDLTGIQDADPTTFTVAV